MRRLVSRNERTRPGHDRSLFADVVELTPLSQRLPPVEVVGVPDQLFSRFDALVERHGLEKIYDLAGDAVNTASRMESHGVPGEIQISRATYELVRDEFVCGPRGTISVKGKGEMETWYLEGPRSDDR